MTIRYIETLTDPTTGEQLTFVGDSIESIDQQISEHFGGPDTEAPSSQHRDTGGLVIPFPERLGDPHGNDN